MNIKIVDSWLREHLETKANPSEIARALSLSSVSVERTEAVGGDHVYDIEVTTNRVDLMSVEGIAREAAVSLSEQGIASKFIQPKITKPQEGPISFPIEIISDPMLVNRISAVVMEVEIGKSPEGIAKRLEMSGIRSLNNLIDVTNYVMREIGHPAHVFDFDLLTSKKIIIRESKPGEVITTLDGKEYRLYGGDIVADDGKGTIIDLLGIMGTANSVVRENTKRILFFLDNNNPQSIRRTSMSLGIRTEAAIINEKGVDPQLLEEAFYRGIELYEEIAEGRVVSKFYDYYPNPSKINTVKVSNEKINKLIGVDINPNQSTQILEKLGFGVKKLSDSIEVETPTNRPDVKIPEDVIEEIARIYGYQKLPSVIPSFLNSKTVPYANHFYFEERVKAALKYCGYTEVYTYSLVSENLYDGDTKNAVKLKNPLTEDMAYLRNSLVPSLLRVVEENKESEEIRIFELANVYEKVAKNLPKETLTLGGLIKEKNASFFEVKGLIEQLLNDLGISQCKFSKKSDGTGVSVIIENEKAGYIEIINHQTVDFELNFEVILKNANLKKNYKPLAKFPEVKEDITFVLPESVEAEDVISEIKLQSFLISDVTLKDTFENAKTFHIAYQAPDKNLTNQEVGEIHREIVGAIIAKFKARVK